MSDKKKHPDRPDPPRTGSTAPEDEDLTTWLHRLWARNEPPERIELWQVFGRNKLDRGAMVFHEDFKPNANLDPEQANKLANEIIASAKNDCASVGRQQHYQIAVIDRHRRSSPLIRRLGPIMPEPTFLVKTGERGGTDDFDEEDEDGPQSHKSLSLAYTREANEQTRWDKRRYDAVMGDLLTLQSSIITQQQTWVDKMMGERMTFFAQLQDSLDRQLDRDNAREWAKLKVTLARDGLRTARNLLPGLFGPSGTEGEPGPGQGGSNGQTSIGSGNGTGAVEKNNALIDRFGGSPERAIIDHFLFDCEEAGMNVALFGEWEERDGYVEPIEGKPGIFSPQQYAVLIGVRDGKLSPSALDAILPNSGDPKAITQEQVIRAQSLEGMTDAIGMSIIELVGLRQRRREAAIPKESQRTER